jgi:hypothetical protein
MKKWTWIGALALLIGAGYLGFQQYKNLHSRYHQRMARTDWRKPSHCMGAGSCGRSLRPTSAQRHPDCGRRFGRE